MCLSRLRPCVTTANRYASRLPAVLADQPRVTRYQIDWSNSAEASTVTDGVTTMADETAGACGGEMMTDAPNMAMDENFSGQLPPPGMQQPGLQPTGIEQPGLMAMS